MTGTITVEGVDKAETVSVNVNMIDTVAALLNYSTTTSVGVEPILRHQDLLSWKMEQYLRQHSR